jgi:hypothetical protein
VHDGDSLTLASRRRVGWSQQRQPLRTLVHDTERAERRDKVVRDVHGHIGRLDGGE